MLELDLLLTTFLEGAYPELSEEDKILFIVLLECEDPDVFAWLMGQKDPEDKSLQLIVDKIRAHVRKPV